MDNWIRLFLEDGHPGAFINCWVDWESMTVTFAQDKWIRNFSRLRKATYTRKLHQDNNHYYIHYNNSVWKTC